MTRKYNVPVGRLVKRKRKKLRGEKEFTKRKIPVFSCMILALYDCRNASRFHYIFLKIVLGFIFFVLELT